MTTATPSLACQYQLLRLYISVSTMRLSDCYWVSSVGDTSRPPCVTDKVRHITFKIIRYDTIQEFNAGSKAECGIFCRRCFPYLTVFRFTPGTSQRYSLRSSSSMNAVVIQRTSSSSYLFSDNTPPQQYHKKPYNRRAAREALQLTDWPPE